MKNNRHTNPEIGQLWDKVYQMPSNPFCTWREEMIALILDVIEERAMRLFDKGHRYHEENPDDVEADNSPWEDGSYWRHKAAIGLGIYLPPGFLT